MAKRKRKRAEAPPLRAPALDVDQAAGAAVWLDYCAQCFEKQLKLWRRAAKLHRDAASRGSVAYHERGLQAIRWMRGHLEQVLVAGQAGSDRGMAAASFARHVADLWEFHKL